MVMEFAEITVKSGAEPAFIAGVQAAKYLFDRAAGCQGLKLRRSIENPVHFVLNIEWDSVAAHEAFRAGPDFAVWRGNVSAFFAEPPNVWHGETVAE